MANLLSTPQVAERYKITVTQVSRLIRTGYLRAVRIGRVWAIDPDDLPAFEASRPKWGGHREGSGRKSQR